MTDVIKENIEVHYGEKLTENDRLLYGSITFVSDVVAAIAMGKLTNIALRGNDFTGKLYSALETIGNAYESIKEGKDSYRKDGDTLEALYIILKSFFEDIASGKIADKIKSYHIY